MTRTWVRSAAATAVGVGLLAAGGQSASAGNGPTCAGFAGIEVHGQHVVGDYVMGGGHGLGSDLQWPEDYRGMVGEMVRENGGAAVPGGPGPGFHFPNGFAPGASFCTDSAAPGIHI